MRFIEAAKGAGIDGIFYAVQHARYPLMSRDEFTEFGRAYDLRVLEAAQRPAFQYAPYSQHGPHVRPRRRLPGAAGQLA